MILVLNHFIFEKSSSLQMVLKFFYVWEDRLLIIMSSSRMTPNSKVPQKNLFLDGFKTLDIIAKNSPLKVVFDLANAEKQWDY